MIKMKYIVLLFIVLLIFTTTFASEYTVPRSAYSVYAEDLDLDGDKDIVVGHNYNTQTEWSGVSILENNGYGEFTLIDSIFLYSWQTNVYAKIINNDECPEIIGRHFENDTQFMAVLEYNEGIYVPNYYIMEYGISEFVTGDIDNDNDIDIIVASNNGQFWGVMKNDGTGQFLSPEYYYVDYHPGGIACGDLNNDCRDDIIVCGLKLELYLSYPDSFQYILVDDPHYMTNVKIADMNNDGFNDIVTATWYVPGVNKDISIYFNNEEVNFDNIYVKVVEEAASQIFVTDLNNDNYPDIIYNVSYFYPNSEYERTHTYILYNNGDNTLEDPINYLTYLGNCEYTSSLKSFATDLDGNELKDIITINYSYNDDNNVNILFQDNNGNFIEEPQVGVNPQHLPISEFNLVIYPNPFNPDKIGTTINFSINEQNLVELAIYDIKGRLVKQLINKKIVRLAGQNECDYNVFWEGKDENNQCCSSGIYLINLKLNDVSKNTKKVMLLQ